MPKLAYATKFHHLPLENEKEEPCRGYWKHRICSKGKKFRGNLLSCEGIPHGPSILLVECLCLGMTFFNLNKLLLMIIPCYYNLIKLLGCIFLEAKNLQINFSIFHSLVDCLLLDLHNYIKEYICIF